MVVVVDGDGTGAHTLDSGVGDRGPRRKGSSAAWERSDDGEIAVRMELVVSITRDSCASPR